MLIPHLRSNGNVYPLLLKRPKPVPVFQTSVHSCHSEPAKVFKPRPPVLFQGGPHRSSGHRRPRLQLLHAGDGPAGSPPAGAAGAARAGEAQSSTASRSWQGIWRVEPAALHAVVVAGWLTRSGIAPAGGTGRSWVFAGLRVQLILHARIQSPRSPRARVHCPH